jgi:hypothetical protein
MRMRRYPTPWLSLSAAAFCLLAAMAATALVAAAASVGRVAPEAAARLGKPLTADSLAQWDREQLTAIILDGVPGTPMPPWRPLLTEAEARFIADMLKEGKLK